LKISIKGREKPLIAYGFASAPELAERDGDDQEPAPAIETDSTGLQEPAAAPEERAIEVAIEQEPLSGAGTVQEEAAPVPQPAPKRGRSSKAGKSTAPRNTKKSPV
jgi:adenylate cyclase